MENRRRNDEERGAVIVPKNLKRVKLQDVYNEVWVMDNVNGRTGVWSEEDDTYREMLQGRVAFDAMVNSLVMLMGMKIVGVEYSTVEGEQ